MKKIFDGVKYFLDLGKRNVKMQENDFVVATMNLQRGIEPIMQEWRTKEHFFLVDDAPVCSISMNRAGGFFDNRTYVCHIISRVNTRFGLEEYEKKMDFVRELYAEFLERIVFDKVKLRDTMNIYINSERIFYKEPGVAAYGGAAGLYFQVTMSQPKNLEYRQSNWS